MNKFLNAVLIAAALGLALPASAQRGNPAARTSPHETISAVVSGDRITITYGRPYSKDPRSAEIRKIWGALVPWDKAWRMGSDEATTLITQQDLAIGDATIPAGVYTLYMVPSEHGTSKLAFSKTLGGWGIPVDEKHDLVRVDLKKDAAPAQVDQFTMAVKSAGGGGQIVMTWENTQYSVAFTIKK